MAYSQYGSKPDDTSLCQAIIEAIADREGADVTEIEPPEYEPLYEVVDPEALDALFAPTAGGATRATGSIDLQYAGYRVTVSSDGSVELAELTGPDDPADDSSD